MATPPTGGNGRATAQAVVVKQQRVAVDSLPQEERALQVWWLLEGA